MWHHLASEDWVTRVLQKKKNIYLAGQHKHSEISNAAPEIAHMHFLARDHIQFWPIMRRMWARTCVIEQQNQSSLVIYTVLTEEEHTWACGLKDMSGVTVHVWYYI